MTAVVAACLWVVAASGVAMLPMRWQYAPGLALLVAAPLILIWLARAVGLWLALAGLLAVLSMFRRPLLYYARRLREKIRP